MNKPFILISLILIGAITKGFANGGDAIKSSLESATVFFQGAELTHRASASLVKGENEIRISNISPKIDRNSIKIKATNGAIITSFEYSIDYLNKSEVSGITKKLQDSINIYKRQQKDIEVKLKTTENMIALLDANKSIGGTQNGLSVAELAKMMDYYQSKSNEIQNAKRNYEDAQERLEERIDVLTSQMEQETIKNAKSSGILKINLTSPLTTNVNFTISYYTAAAGWTPYYDINVAGTDKPIKMQSKAKVRQTTGLDWSKVKLTLSTSTPSSGKIAPLFSAWFLNFQQSISSALSGRTAGVAVQNSYGYAEQSAPQMKIRGATSLYVDITPLYVVNGTSMDAAEFANIDPSMIDKIEVLKDGAATARYGARAMNGAILVTTKAFESFVARDENELNMTYNIDLPYTIEGNGKIQSIDLQSYDVNAEFKYYCAPKLDTETFLLAEISGWEKLGLLSGKANVTYDGTYVGETMIDASSIHKKLSLTLGTDKRVTVKREKMQDFSSKKILSSDVKQEFVYKLTVRNSQNKPIKMILKDQYPISTQKEIEVELLKETTPATYNNKEVGVLSWEFDMNPGETKEFKTAYSVKSPKDKDLNL